MTERDTHLSPERTLELQALWFEIESAALAFLNTANVAGLEASFHIPEVRSRHDRLSDLFSTVVKPEEVGWLSRSERFTPLSQTLRELNATLHRRTEIAEAMLQASEPTNAEGIGKMWVTAGFQELLRFQACRWKTLGLLGADVDRPIYVVGGGALPQSQWVLHECTGRQIVAVEKDSASVSAARAFLAARGRSDDLPVIHADGRWAKYIGAAVVVIATLVPEKIDVAIRVAETAPPDTILNIRVPVGLHIIWRADIDLSSMERAGWVLRDRWCQGSSAIASLTFARCDSLSVRSA